MTEGRGSLFREEAVKHAAAMRGGGDGDILRLSPAWTRWAYWVLVAAFGLGTLFMMTGTVHEYAAGPAVIWVAGRTSLTATASGTVETVEVQPGQQVEAGAVLMRFHAEREIAELEQIQREFDLQLAKSLRDPLDQASKQTLTALRTQRDLAQSRIEQLAVRAPKAGVIGDVRIRSGQLLSQGDVVLTMLGQGARTSIVSMLPAHFRPQLRPGMSLRFEPTGYRYAYQDMMIESVSTQIIGPNEVQRYLGQEIADTIKVEGPVVLVEARPSAPTFEVDGVRFEMHHGMNGTAEARVRSETILLTLLPGLRAVLEVLRA
ncbi:HlyD family efflux transporter periplasmic adaptor subunit [Chondromyces apiculatus]|uniref:RND efflux membrane fusion protein, putative n=1 Tax=Chondromyces apiculatus DSM 436 TaxID=1192034 RepID=A0A017T3H8_9BACT|nr:efflux RND transporter periplasmic adaptor subunit [Chondromyces apiculatus]EYF03086.1 RND efflux membrane fusion protein, putative [Chondromyces apiculatus DSM 436]